MITQGKLLGINSSLENDGFNLHSTKKRKCNTFLRASKSLFLISLKISKYSDMNFYEGSLLFTLVLAKYLYRNFMWAHILHSNLNKGGMQEYSCTIDKEQICPIRIFVSTENLSVCLRLQCNQTKIYTKKWGGFFVNYSLFVHELRNKIIYDVGKVTKSSSHFAWSICSRLLSRK